METVKDSVVTVSQGAGGVALSFWDALPDMLRIAILFVTLAHITIKVVKSYRN
jgi:hypothetical protein